MSTKRKPTAAKYQRLTDKQLVALIRKWQKKYVSLAKKPAGKMIQGWTPAQIRTAFARELKVVAFVLRVKAIKKIDAKLTELKSQHAKRFGYAKNSPLVTNATIKRLLAKRRQVLKSKGYLPLATLIAALKIESFKNPAFKANVRKAKRTIRKAKRTARRTIRKAKRTVRRAKRKTAIKAVRLNMKAKRVNAKLSKITTKHKAKTKSLKKEIKKLKQRNSFMRAQVAKFRKEVAQMQRHYGSLKSTATPRLRLVSNKKVGQDVSNIVRFSNALSNAVKSRTFG